MAGSSVTADTMIEQIVARVAPFASTTPTRTRENIKRDFGFVLGA